MYWISPQPLTGWLWQLPPLTHPLSCGPECLDCPAGHGGAAIVTDDETGSPAFGPEALQDQTNRLRQSSFELR